MSPQSVLVFISRGKVVGNSIRRGYSHHPDATCLELFSWALVGQEKCPTELSASLEQSIDLVWEDMSDFVDPFGDRRGSLFDSVWTFDLDKDLLYLRKSDQYRLVSLELARKRLLTLDDFELLNSPRQLSVEEQSLPGPYWEPKLDLAPREKSFIGKILRDFGFTWRHILRRPMNTTTFLQLAYATMWISTLDFIIVERMGFEHVTTRGPYVDVVDLPSWETPKATLVKAGSCWFALAQETLEGLEMVQRHMTSQLEGSTTDVRTYAILTLRCIILCQVQGSKLIWTRCQALFNDDSTSDTAIDMIIWATNTTSAEQQPNAISSLPVEIQDKVLYCATTSFIASAKLGCELGLGSPLSWVDGGLQIMLQGVKRHRTESSPVESQIHFGRIMSGLSYKPERNDRILPVSRFLVGKLGRA
ncbi:hypothetical protein ED733_007413 [Metarhizium rileyi]|uniref:Uncharacterized protein n=1 Tax=Metarhizium rileyi (strain RCEF 4871) TaxID=1649241 RepID=A0A5C6GGD1_METRR|nr:hypothetical protein ED733_007413 [Metarhizium rileyi]